MVYHSWNADTEAFRQITSYYEKVTLYTKFGLLVLRKIIEIGCHWMSYFKAKMHQMRFPLALPDPLAGLRGLLLREGKGREGLVAEGEVGRGRRERGGKRRARGAFQQILRLHPAGQMA